MKARPPLATVCAWIGAVVLISACGSSASDPEGDTTVMASTAMATGESTSATTTASTTGGETTGPMGDGVLQCVETCEVPTDCCVPGTPCPGAYPYNIDCIDGLCIPPSCVDDTECQAVAASTVCRPVAGNTTCVVPCADDAPCTAIDLGVCAGSDDDGARFCLRRCDAPGEFCGNQTCDSTSGRCTCSSDGQCQSSWRCVD